MSHNSQPSSLKQPLFASKCTEVHTYMFVSDSFAKRKDVSQGVCLLVSSRLSLCLLFNRYKVHVWWLWGLSLAVTIIISTIIVVNMITIVVNMTTLVVNMRTIIINMRTREVVDGCRVPRSRKQINQRLHFPFAIIIIIIVIIIIIIIIIVIIITIIFIFIVIRASVNYSEISSSLCHSDEDNRKGKRSIMDKEARLVNSFFCQYLKYCEKSIYAHISGRGVMTWQNIKQMHN